MHSYVRIFSKYLSRFDLKFHFVVFFFEIWKSTFVGISVNKSIDYYQWEIDNKSVNAGYFLDLLFISSIKTSIVPSVLG